MITPATIRIGAAIWRAVAPWRRLKMLRNKRRARLGKPLLPITREDDLMLPNGSATYTGAGITVAALPIGIAVTVLSPKLTNLIIAAGMAPEMCSPDAANCVSASAMSIALITGVVSTLGAWLVAWGRKRAEKRHDAELAAAKTG